ncbi:MAG: hypothetical protein AAF203_07730, partial [Pseudomonadota bacterium]
MLRFIALLSIILLFSACSGSSDESLLAPQDIPYDAKTDPQVDFLTQQSAVINRSFATEEEIPMHQWVRGYERCKSSIDQLSNFSDRYERLFNLRKYAEANDTLNQIHGLFGDRACFAPLWRAYLVLLSVFERDSLQLAQDLSAGGKRYIPFANELQIVTLYLVNQDIFRPLSPKGREKLQAEHQSALWTAKGEGGYQITGFYNCLETRIYLGTELKPYNLLASLRHEMDHLYRDKFVSLEDFAAQISIENDDPIRSYISHDELYATMSGGYNQRRALAHREREASFHAKAGNDFNFFASDGTLNSLFEEHETLPLFSDYLFSADFYSGDTGQKILNLTQLVRKGYFGKGIPPGTGISINFRIYPQNLEWGWLASFRLLVQENEGDRLNEFIRKALKEWGDELSSSSQSCKKAVEHQNKGKLDDYLGA